MNQNQFLLDSGFWGWLYKLLYPVEWLMTQIWPDSTDSW